MKIFLLFALPAMVAAVAETLVVSGSGTTNPSKCYWLIMSQIMDRLAIPAKLTYRAVGSSTGQKEFKGVSLDLPDNDFGSGDIPFSTEDYNLLNAAGVDFVHLPVVLGAISIFHSIPGVPDGSLGLNLTSCNIAKIFKREILTWDDDEIIENNPNLKDLLPSAGYPIQVAHRRLGSSSTASVTQYLRESCPGEWPEDLVGNTIEWPTDTLTCEGSGGMTDCIRNNPGTIGYIDAGHGHSENLVEIELRNFDGNFVSSKKAAANGGIGAAAGVVAGLAADDDFGEADLLNAEGEFTWPIVAMSYVYVRKNLSHIQARDQGLLIAFLKALYDPDYIGQCNTEFAFTPVPDEIKRIALEGIDMLKVDATAPVFTFESSTLPNEGQGDYVISSKRLSYAEYERSVINGVLSSNGADDGAAAAMMASLQAEIDSLKADVSNYATQLAALEDDVEDLPATGGTANGVNDGTASGVFTDAFGDKESSQLTAALAMGAVSIVLWGLLIIGGALKMCSGSSSSGGKSYANGDAVA